MLKESAPREVHKVRMLEIAERILQREGLSALQARRVAKEAGCSVGTLYNVFDGLDDLIIQANAKTLSGLGQALLEAREGVATDALKDQLMAMALGYLSFAIRHTVPWRAVFEHRMADGEVPEWYRASQARLFALVEDALGPHVADATHRRRAARALFAAVHGIVSLALDRKLGEFDPVEAEAEVRLVVGAAADGLARHAASDAASLLGPIDRGQPQ